MTDNINIPQNILRVENTIKVVIFYATKNITIFYSTKISKFSTVLTISTTIENA